MVKDKGEFIATIITIVVIFTTTQILILYAFNEYGYPMPLGIPQWLILTYLTIINIGINLILGSMEYHKSIEKKRKSKEMERKKV